MPAQVYICQGGCGAFEPDVSKMHTRGIVNEKLYCEKCVVRVDEYLKLRDDLHTQLADEWSAGLAGMAYDFADVLKALPDA